MCRARSTTRLEQPHSLSYQAINFMKRPLSWMPALLSTMQDLLSPTKSWETTCSRVNPRTPFISSWLAFSSMSMTWWYSAPRQSLTVRSTTDTSAVGTLKAMPVSLPLSWGSTLPTAVAAPVEEGMRLLRADRPALQSLPPLLGPSTVSWVAVTACTVVMSPSSIPQFLSSRAARGARQLVVQEALDTTWCCSDEQSWWLTPITNIGVSSLAGAEIITFRAPPCRWPPAASVVKNTPEDSHTQWAPTSPQGMSLVSLWLNTLTSWPLISRWLSSFFSTEPQKRPCTESYFSWQTMQSISMKGSLMATRRTYFYSRAALVTKRPMRPNPFIPSQTQLLFSISI